MAGDIQGRGVKRMVFLMLCWAFMEHPGVGEMVQMEVSSVKVKGIALMLILTSPVLMADITDQSQAFPPKPLKFILII